MKISADRLTGNILNQLSGDGVEVITMSDSVLFTANSLTIQYSPWKMIIGKFAIDEIHLDKPVIYYSEGLELLARQLTTGRQEREPNPVATAQRQFTIETFRINEGQFVYGTGKEQFSVSKITGEMRIDQTVDTLSLTGDFTSLEAIRPQQRLRSIEFLVHQYPDSVVLNHMEFMYDSASVLLSGTIDLKPSPLVSLQYQTKNFSFASFLPQFGITYFKQDFWDIEGSMQTDLQEYAFETTFTGQFDANTTASGDLDFTITDQNITMDQSYIHVNNGSMSIQGRYALNSGGNANVQLTNINLEAIQQSLPETNITGRIQVNESSGNLSSPVLNGEIQLDRSAFSNVNIAAITGEVTFQRDTLSVVDSLQAKFAAADWVVQGWVTRGGGLAVKGSMETERFDYFTTALDLPMIYGESKSRFSLNGTIENTAIDTRVKFQNFGLREFHFDTVAAYLSVENLQQLRDGELFVEARNGEAWGKEVATGSISAISRNDSFIVRNFQLDAQEDHLIISGGVSRNLKGHISELELQYQNAFIHNRTSIPFQITEKGVRVAQGVVGINNGLVNFTGKVKDADNYQTQIEVTNIELGPLNSLLEDPLPFNGVLNGSFTYESADTNKIASGNLELTNVIFRDLHYSKLAAELRYADKQLSISSVELHNPEGGTAKISSTLPVDLEGLLEQDSLVIDEQSAIIAEIELSKIFLEDYAQFIHIPQQMAGEVTGSMSVSGSMANPVASYDLTVLHPRFDKIEGYQVSTQGTYKNQRLIFKNINLLETKENGRYTGSGYLPISANFANAALYLRREDQMNLRFHAETPRLQFINKYIGDVDAVTGDFVLDLRVSGTPDNPRRDGQITIENAQIEVSSLENEVQKVNGRGVLRNNQMEIEDFTAHMHDTQDREIIEGAFNRFQHWITGLFNRDTPELKPNVNLTGTLNFENFFSPGLNLQMDGENVYIRSLLGEIEGVVDANLTITGRDSLIIVGDLEPEEVVLRMDFAKSSTPKEAQSTRKGGRYVEYNMHTTFPGNFYIRNDQVNAEFEGDIWIVRHGSEPVNFSGSLNVIRGKYYYYNDTFTIQEGQIFFDPVEFNPRLNIVATTEIEDQVEVVITLSGELDNPKISLETPNVATKYSESEILSILTFNTQIEQEGLSTPEIQSIFTTYLERQFESYGSQLIGLETFDVEAEGQSLQQLENVTITVGRQVAPNLYFTYGRGFFAENPTNKLGLEYQLNRYMSFVGEIDEEGLYHFKYRLKYNY